MDPILVLGLLQEYWLSVFNNSLIMAWLSYEPTKDTTDLVVNIPISMNIVGISAVIVGNAGLSTSGQSEKMVTSKSACIKVFDTSTITIRFANASYVYYYIFIGS